METAGLALAERAAGLRTLAPGAPRRTYLPLLGVSPLRWRGPASHADRECDPTIRRWAEPHELKPHTVTRAASPFASPAPAKEWRCSGCTN